jgi:hypothetical protein
LPADAIYFLILPGSALPGRKGGVYHGFRLMYNMLKVLLKVILPDKKGQQIAYVRNVKND